MPNASPAAWYLACKLELVVSRSCRPGGAGVEVVNLENSGRTDDDAARRSSCSRRFARASSSSLDIDLVVGAVSILEIPGTGEYDAFGGRKEGDPTEGVLSLDCTVVRVAEGFGLSFSAKFATFDEVLLAAASCRFSWASRFSC